MPTSIGYQDLASLIARERGVTTSWHMIASPLGTVQAATFSYTRPIGTAIPEPLGFQDVNFDPRSLDAYAWKIDEPLTVQHARQIEYPSVDRAQKGDRLPASDMTPASTAPASLAAIATGQRAGRIAVSPALQPAPPPILAPQPAKPNQSKPSNTRKANDAAPLVVQTDVHHDVSTAMAPAAATSGDDLVVGRRLARPSCARRRRRNVVFAR